MANGKAKGSMGETCIKALKKIFIKEKYGREREIENDYLEKGTLQEPVSLTLLSEVDNVLYLENKKQFKNDFVKGRPDSLPFNREKFPDIKTCWDIFTFFNAELTAKYEYQLIGYMWLTGRKESEIVYTLVNTPEHLIEREESRTFYKMGVVDRDDFNYQLACAEIRRCNTFDDIPKEERIKRFTVLYDEEKIEQIKTRLLQCREYLNKLATK
jgi:hypothetical protein